MFFKVLGLSLLGVKFIRVEECGGGSVERLEVGF